MNNNPGNTLAASTDDTDTLYGITGGTGSDAGANSARVLQLSSGDVIWDFSGNVYEWTAPAQSINQVGVSGDSAFNWREWTLGSLNFGSLPSMSRPNILSSYVNPITGASLASVASWDASKGVGRIYANYSDAGSRAFFRGGGWNSNSYAGVLTLRLNSGLTSTSLDTNIGFRVAR